MISIWVSFKCKELVFCDGVAISVVQVRRGRATAQPSSLQASLLGSISSLSRLCTIAAPKDSHCQMLRMLSDLPYQRLGLTGPDPPYIIVSEIAW